MLIRSGYEISIYCETATPVLCALSPRPEIRPVLGDGFPRTSPNVPTETYIDSFGNRMTRVSHPGGTLTLTGDFVVEDDGAWDICVPDAPQVPVDQLPFEALRHLIPSRFIESDLLANDAWRLFGHVTPGWARVQAISDFVFNHITFGYQHGRPTKTAMDAYREGNGVCRDFAQLSVAFCRAMNIPARYVSGYIGDIGVPYSGPMDFCAWFEVYLGDRWYTFDARYNIPRIGRILMVRGMDAADVSMITTYGTHRMDKFEVWCDELPADTKIDDLRPLMRVPTIGSVAA